MPRVQEPKPAIFKGLTFRAEGHSYWHDGARLPSVTEIIGQVITPGAFDRIPPGTLEIARARGKAVHSATFLHDVGNLDETTVEPEYLAHLEAWKQYRRDTGFTPEYLEHRVMGVRAGRPSYAGTIDRIGMIGKAYVLLDIKTGAAKATDALQLAAYSFAVQDVIGILPDMHILLYFKYTATGLKYLPTVVKQKQILDLLRPFNSAVDVYNYRQSIGFTMAT